MDLVVCPHCKAHRIVTIKVPKDVVVVMPCPSCHELIVLFRNRIIALSRRILERGTQEERKAHLADVIGEFLDEGLFYSSAYFQQPDMSLEEAQQAKCRHILRKLRLEAGDTVLDVGSGWGSLALYLAQQAEGVQVIGLVRTPHELRVAEQRAEVLGLDTRVHFVLEDLRRHQGDYDRIVSVSMFERVGRRRIAP